MSCVYLIICCIVSFVPRGFAFVEFGSKQEAAAAMEATAGTHLYGRRLVVETAGEDAGMSSTMLRNITQHI